MNNRKPLLRLILLGTLAALLSGCAAGPEETIKDGESTEKIQITWAMPLDYYEMTELGENVTYLNELLAEDGYACQLSFMPMEAEAYADIISSGKTEGVDILSLGLAAEGTASVPQKLLQAEVLYDLTDYLHSSAGSGLYGAFYEKLWDSVTIGGKTCVIPNQFGQDGTGYAAFRRDIFGDTVQWDGTVEGLLTLADQAAISEDMSPVLWGASLLHISSSMGYEYYHGFFVSLEDGSCHFPYQTQALQETYVLLNEWYHSGRLQLLPNSEKRSQIITEENYAICVNSDWRKPQEAVAEDYVFMQLPFTFSTRINGGIGVCSASNNKETALELLTLLFTQEDYANALLWGEPGVKYELTDNMAVHLNKEHGSVMVASLMTGIYDLVYPMEEDDFPVNRKDTKWSLYGTEAERASHTMGLLLDTSAFQGELTTLESLSQEYESIWQSEDMAAVWDEVNRQYEEAGGAAVAAELEKQINR